MNLVVTLLVGMLSIRPTDSLSLQGCGEGATSIRGRIVGGKLSRQGMWPWQVGIHKQSIFDSSRYNIICGGALIAPQWVLTAAHCFYTRRTSSSKIWHEEDITSLKRYKIIAGDIDTQIREISEQERFPIEVYIHPGYRHDPYYENDIALVKLNQTVTLSPLVRTVCLPISDVDFAKPGTVGTVAGWGRTRKSRISTVLKHTTIGIKDNAICKKATTYFFNKTVTFCAGDGNGRNDTCQGDSGGSLVRSVSVNGRRIWVTVGLVSWGEGCGLPGKYGYYTRVHSFVDWINSSMLSCGNPGNIPFGRLIKAHRMKRFPMDFRVKYKCIDGYVLKGKSGCKCKGEGRWTRRPVCVREITCPDPGHPHNGVRGPSKGSYRYKKKIQFHCNRNHVMIGRSSLTCQIDGTWNDYPPLCLDPGVPENGIRLGINFKHGQTVRFACKKNNMIGSPLITCLNGTWNMDTPKCFKGNCRGVGNIRNAVINKNNNRQVDVQRINGVVYKHGDRISIWCRDGFRINGNPVLKCNDGIWSDINPTCIGVCTSLDAPQHGERLDLNFDYGLTVRFRCYSRYTLQGNKSVTCINGIWSNKAPVCKADCQDPGTPANGQRNGSIFSHLQTVRFSCYKEFIMIGASSIECRDGTWSSNKPVCTECGSPLGMENRNIPDKNIRASSRWNRWYDAVHGRLNGGSAWCSGLGNRRPYLEIDLSKPYKITYLATQGLNYRYKKWVSKYIVSHNLAGSSFILYREASKEQLFTGNSDATSIVKHKLKKPFIARKIRFLPVGLPLIGRLFNRACMRVEIYGCDLPIECGSPLGMENRKIPHKNIRASSRWDWWYDAVHGRLNSGSAWCSSLRDIIPYLEIDLSKPYKITYVATQGLNNRYKKWVSKYIVSHNLAGSSFIEYREASKEKLFTGNSDATSIVKHKLKNPFIARKIRFLPVGLPLFGHLFNRAACMRVEIYGCDLPIDCVMVGSRVLGRWGDNYHGGYNYYKAIVRTIDSYNVQLEIEDEDHHDESFKTMPKTSIVLDVPNKQLNLPQGRRVLMPKNNKYYTGTIDSRLNQDYYLVDPDNNKIGKTWIKKKEIRVLKLKLESEQFCE